MRLTLISGPSQIRPEPNQILVAMDSWATGPNTLSLPRLVSENLLSLRTEHARWAFELGNAGLASSLKAGSELSMWWCSTLYERHPKVSPSLYDVYRLRALERRFDWTTIEEVQTKGCSPEVNACLRAFCTKKGIPFSAQDRKEKASSLLRKLYAKTPAPLRALARFAHWLVTVRRHLNGPVALEKTEKPSATIATYFPNIDMGKAKEGIFRSRYFETLHDILGHDFAMRWLFIRFPSPQASLSQCKELCKSFTQSQKSGISFRYIEEFLSPKDLFSAFSRFLSLAAASWKSEKDARPAFHFTGSELDLWPLLGPEYAESFRGWRCLERCLQQKGIENYVALAGPQVFYSFPLENCPWERMLTHAVHSKGYGPVFGAQHSSIRPTDFRYFDDPRTWQEKETLAWQPDLVLGNGESACRQWREAGVPTERLGKIEALRYLYLLGKKQEGSSKILLVATSFFADETEEHLSLFAEAVLANLLNEFSLVVKAHPYLPVEERVRELLGERAKEIRFSSNPLPEELAQNPIVWASNSTTVALEAAIRGLPVFVMQTSKDFDLCPIQDIPSLSRTSDLASVKEALEKIQPLHIGPDYLCLDSTLPRWKKLITRK